MVGLNMFLYVFIGVIFYIKSQRLVHGKRGAGCFFTEGNLSTIRLCSPLQETGMDLSEDRVPATTHRSPLFAHLYFIVIYWRVNPRVQTITSHTINLLNLVAASQ